MRTRIRVMPALLAALAVAAGCDSGSKSPSPGLTVSPTTATVTAGGAAAPFTATLTGSTETINWAFSPAVGTLSATTGATVTYTPPATVASTTTVTLTATAGTYTATASITVNPPPAPALTLSPTTATVTAGGAAAPFTATLTGSTATINWSLSPATGTLSAATGASTNYTPPASVASATTVTLTATAGALTATATITVNPAGTATLTLSRTSATVTAGGAAEPFTATLTGSTATINWSISPATGTLSPATGASTNYTPPATVASATTVTLTATAGTLTATATITLNPAAAATLTVSPTTATVTAGGAAAPFTATLTGSTATINWSLSPATGTLSAATGASTNYTPPATVASATTVTLTATAGTLTATATITVNPAGAATLTVSPTTATVTAGGTAVAFAATLTGSTATISWSLSPATGTLSAATGASTNYTPPASVGGVTTVTLTATAGTLTATATITVNPSGGGTITVNGTVLLDDGTPLANAPVRIDPGAHAATTAANGTFSISGVTTPYNLAAINPVEKVAVVYVGLTRTDPTAHLPTQGVVPPLPARSATISGTVESSTGCRAGSEPCQSDLEFVSSVTGGSGNANPGTGLYSILPEWDGVASFQGTLHLFQTSTNATTQKKSYWYGAKNGVTVTDGGTTTENWGSSSVTALPAATLSGTGTVAAGYTVFSASLSLVLGNVQFLANSCNSILGPAEPPCAAGPYTVDAPNLTGATLTGVVLAQGTNGEAVYTMRTGGTANGTGFDFAIQAAPSLQAPADLATGVTTATPFSWTAFSGGVHEVVFNPAVATDPQYYVYTAGTSTTIPNLGALSASVTLPAGATYSWSVIGFAPSSINAWASTSGPTPFPNPVTFGNSQGFGFTTQ